MNWLYRLLYQTLRLVGLLPISLRRRIGSLVGLLLWYLPTRDKLIAILQLRLIFPDKDYYRLSRQVYSQMGVSLFEFLNLKPLLDNSSEMIICDDNGLIDWGLKLDRPIVALTAHYCNWDLLAAYFVKRGAKLCAVGREMRSIGIHSVLASLRDRYSIETLWRSPQRGPKDVIERLKANWAVAALIDQDTDVSSVPITFFGRPARTPSGLIALGRRYNAFFVSAFISRMRDGRFRIDLRTFDEKLDVEELLLEYNRRLEQEILENPIQWAWLHKRWRTLENGVRLSSAQYVQQLNEWISSNEV